MKFIFKLLAVCLLPLWTSAVVVRVLLNEHQSPEWHISSSHGLCLQDIDTEKMFPSNVTYQNFSIIPHGKSLVINGQKVDSTQALIEPFEGYLTFDGNKYDGRFFITYEKDTWYLINVLDIEEYVHSVLKTESWPGWPLEINKVFAIACRSYVLYQLLNARERDKPYHIKNTNHHQTYQGIHSNDIVRQAVEETRGIFVSYNKKPILAMFDCCCGGVIPAKVADGINFVEAPYLKRKYACTYCKGSKLYSWSVSYPMDTFATVLRESRNLPNHPIKEVKISRKDDAGLVKKVSFRTQKGWFSLKGQEMYSSFKGIKSYCFSILKKGKTVTVSGKGYGHHMGMCQWGAREMVQRGYSHSAILDFYYPGTCLMKLVHDGSEKTIAA